MLAFQGGTYPAQRILPHSNWIQIMRHVPRIGSHTVQCPAHVPHVLKLGIHFLAEVGASAPPSTMLCGPVGLKLGMGGWTACFARLPTALFPRTAVILSTACYSS